MNTEIIAVGSRYPVELGGDEGCRVCWSKHGFEILACFSAPTEKEISGFQSGYMEFRLHFLNNISWLSFNVSDSSLNLVLPWQEMPINLSIVAEDSRPQLNEFNRMLENPNSRLTVTPLLIDHNTRIIQAMRFCTVSPEFSKALVSQQLICLETPISRQEYATTVQQTCARFCVGQIAEGSTVICKSGD